MRLMPKRVKFRKSQRQKNVGNATRGNRVCFGEFGLQSLEHCWVSAQQIESGRIAATRYVSREGKLVIRIFPHKSITAKPIETRMGKGKGEPDKWVAVVKPGTVLYEIGGVPEDIARQAFTRVAYKMPVKVRFINRRQTI